MFGNLKNLASMMGDMGQMREKAEALQQELAKIRVDADAGAGAVHVTMDGRFHVLRVELDPAMLSAILTQDQETDRAMVEELIAAAVNAAHEKAQAAAQQEIMRMTGGMNIPGLDKLIGGQ